MPTMPPKMNRPVRPSVFDEAERLWRKGATKAAFNLFLAGAKAGNCSCQLNLGYFYQTGIGVRRNSSNALTWYERAYRQGDTSAANNIGTIWRDRRRPKQALLWFRRAVKLGDDSSNLEIAKIFLKTNGNLRVAARLLGIVLKSSRVSEADTEEAAGLLSKIQVRKTA